MVENNFYALKILEEVQPKVPNLAMIIVLDAKFFEKVLTDDLNKIVERSRTDTSQTYL
jgi:hypothetical protein